MGGNSSSGNTSSGALSGLFMGNQPTQTGQQSTVPTIMAPQSQIGQFGAMPQMPSVQQPVNYTPSPQPMMSLLGIPVQPPKFTADPSNPGYGWMRLMDGSEHGQPTYSRQYVSAPQQPQQAPYQPSQASQMAAAINAQYGKK